MSYNYKAFPVLYVTYQDRTKPGSNEIVGFLTPYEKGAAFRTRKKTADEWAYSSSPKKRSNNEEPAPEFLLNKELEGFRLGRPISHGFKSKREVWRVTDPRGFELEIDCKNLHHVISNSDIVDGVVQKKCLWSRLGQNNFLTVVGTDEYEKAIRYMKPSEDKKISLKDLKPGMKVTFKTGEFGVYLGKYYTFSRTWIDGGSQISWSKKKKELFFYDEPKRACSPIGCVKAFSSVRPIHSMESGPKDFLKESEINQLLQSRKIRIDDYRGYTEWVSFISEKAHKIKEFRLDDIDYLDLPNKNEIVVAEKDEKYYVLDRHDIRSLIDNGYSVKTEVVKEKLLEGRLVSLEDSSYRLGGHLYSNRRSRSGRVDKSFNFKVLKIVFENGKEIEALDL